MVPPAAHDPPEASPRGAGLLDVAPARRRSSCDAVPGEVRTAAATHRLPRRGTLLVLEVLRPVGKVPVNVSYSLAYRLGITPWERAMEVGADQFTALIEREEVGRAAPFGHALDLGCSTGAHAVQLAGRGWDVSAVDAVPSAVRRTEERAEEHGVHVHALEGDVTALDPARVGAPVDFFLDAGCFNGLRRGQRSALGRGITACAAPDATLLVLAFAPGRRGPLPRGASRSDVTGAFPGWDVVAQDAADDRGFPVPLRATAPRWYRLRHR